MIEKSQDCDSCHSPMNEYSTAGHRWLKCRNTFCGKIIYLDRKQIDIKDNDKEDVENKP